jgi:hypothetical protein
MILIQNLIWTRKLIWPELTIPEINDPFWNCRNVTDTQNQSKRYGQNRNDTSNPIGQFKILIIDENDGFWRSNLDWKHGWALFFLWQGVQNRVWEGVWGHKKSLRTINNLAWTVRVQDCVHKMTQNDGPEGGQNGVLEVLKSNWH